MLTLALRRVVRAPRPVVYETFCDPAELAKWWGPKGFTTPCLEFGARVGGSYRIEMQPLEGDAFFLTGEFREVEPPARLVFTFVWEDPDPDDVETLVALAFRPRRVARFTATAGRTASTDSSASSPPDKPQPERSGSPWAGFSGLALGSFPGLDPVFVPRHRAPGWP